MQTTDYGSILAKEQDSIATNALVVIAVGRKRPWFHHIAYCLVDHINAEMQAQIIKEAINLLTEAGLDVHGVTFDGCAKNLATARHLGYNLNNLDSSFKHPSRPGKILYVIHDVCHMLKLACNSLGDKKVFFTNNGNISQNYLMFKKVMFCILEISLNTHTKWHNQKMKVAINDLPVARSPHFRAVSAKDLGIARGQTQYVHIVFEVSK